MKLQMNKNNSISDTLKKGWNGFLYFLKKGGWFCFLMFFLDLGTKLGMNAYFGNPVSPLHSNVDIIPGVLYLTLTYNTGAAYGSGKDFSWFMANA